MAKSVRVPPRNTGKVNLAVVEVIQPGPFRDTVLRQELRNAIHRTLTDMRQLFRATTRTWATRVEWDEQESTAGGLAFASVTTEDSLYYLIDHGAQPHPIYAVEKPLLIFSKDYEPKTAPGVIDSENSFHSSDVYRTTEVMHPGFEPRDFDETIRDIIEPSFREEIQEALDRFARKSGHSMSI